MSMRIGIRSNMWEYLKERVSGMKSILAVIGFCLGMLVGYTGYQHFLNRGAQFHVGDCFRAKLVPATIQIIDISDGKYRFIFQFLFLKKEDVEIIERFDSAIGTDFDKVDCQTGEKR